MPEVQGGGSLPGILAAILRTKLEEIELLEGRARETEDAAGRGPPVRDFGRALSNVGSVSLIAECKRRSPGAGPIRPDLDPVILTRGYEAPGAAALSVLTDASYFGGSAADLRAVRRVTGIPILRKDFTLHPLQVVEARAIGADAVLLIVRILSDADLATLLSEAEGLGMCALVEVHDARELARALEAGAGLIGINNRDLSTFRTDLGTTLRLLEEVPAGTLVVSESGIRDASDVARLGAAGVDAVLVGECLLRAADPGTAAADMARVPRNERFHA